MARPMPTGERGFTLLGLLFLVAGLGVAMVALGTVWHTAGQREKEKELLFVGEEYRHAIASFWRASPQGQQRLPKSVDELLRDPRFPNTVRHLRRAYADPMKPGLEWGWVKDATGGIAGVYSQFEGKPYRQAGFSRDQGAFEHAATYKQWLFLFKPDQAAGNAGQAGSPSRPSGKAMPKVTETPALTGSDAD